MKLDERAIYVGFGRRLLAGFVNLLLVLAIVVTLVLLRLASEESPPRASSLAENIAGLWAISPWLLATMLSAQTLFWSFLTATPGMLLLGCQVVRADTGRPLSLFQSLVRCIALWMGIACLGIGVLWSIWDPRHRGLHDKLAGSVIVEEDESLMALGELLRGVK